MNNVKKYIEGYNKNKYIVIPTKDKANFLDAGIKKLIQKSFSETETKKSLYPYRSVNSDGFSYNLNHLWNLYV